MVASVASPAYTQWRGLPSLGAVVDHVTLTRSTRPDGDGVPYGLLRVQILHVRRRLEPLGLSIRTVQGRGYVLEPSD